MGVAKNFLGLKTREEIEKEEEKRDYDRTLAQAIEAGEALRALGARESARKLQETNMRRPEINNNSQGPKNSGFNLSFQK